MSAWPGPQVALAAFRGLAGTVFVFMTCLTTCAMAQGLQFLSPSELEQIPTTPVYRAFLPASVDLSNRFPRPGRQGSQGSCVGWAVGYATRSYYQLRDLKNKATPFNIASPAYIYNTINRTPQDCNNGSLITDALDLLKVGAASLADAPYDERTCRRPSAAVHATANRFRIKSWLRVDHTELDQIKAELANGHPVVLGMTISDDLDNLKGQEIYRRNSPSNGAGHAMAIVGYDEARRAFKAINSWGQKWGENGFGWISYEAFFLDAREAYVMRPEEPVPPMPRPQPDPPQIAVVPVPGPLPTPTPQEIDISEIGCSRIWLRDGDDGPSLRGFVGTAADLDTLKRRFGPSAVESGVSIRPWPQCELLLTLDAALSGLQPQIELLKPDAIYAEGMPLTFTIITPAVPTFLHVAYVQADGSVVNLVQTENQNLAARQPNARLVFGDEKLGGAKFTIGAPFGTELIVAITSASPLFSVERPRVETERAFLTALRQALLSRPTENSATRYISAAIQPIITNAAAPIVEGPNSEDKR